MSFRWSCLIAIVLLGRTLLPAQAPQERYAYATDPPDQIGPMSFTVDGRYLRIGGEVSTSGWYDGWTFEPVDPVDSLVHVLDTLDENRLHLSEGRDAVWEYQAIKDKKGRWLGSHHLLTVENTTTKQAEWTVDVSPGEPPLQCRTNLLAYRPAEQRFLVARRTYNEDKPSKPDRNELLFISYVDRSVTVLGSMPRHASHGYPQAAFGRYIIYDHLDQYYAIDTRDMHEVALRTSGYMADPRYMVTYGDTLVAMVATRVRGWKGEEQRRELQVVVCRLDNGALVRDTTFYDVCGHVALAPVSGNMVYSAQATDKVSYQCRLMAYNVLDGRHMGPVLGRGSLAQLLAATRASELLEHLRTMGAAERKPFTDACAAFVSQARTSGWRVSLEREIGEDAASPGGARAEHTVEHPCVPDSVYAAVLVAYPAEVQLSGESSLAAEDLQAVNWVDHVVQVPSTSFAVASLGIMRLPRSGERLRFDHLLARVNGDSLPQGLSRFYLLARAAGGAGPLPPFADASLQGMYDHDLNALHQRHLGRQAELKAEEEEERRQAEERERIRQAEVTRRNAALMRLQQQVDAAVPATWPLCNSCGGTGRVPEQRSTCHCCGGKGGYTESVPTFHKTGDKRVERPNYISPTHPTTDVYYEPIGYTTYQSVRHACDCCGGTGSEGSGPTVECPACGGKGRVPH